MSILGGGGLLSNSSIDTLQSLPSSVGNIGPLKRAPPTPSSLGGFSSYQQQPQPQAASLSQSRQQVERLKQGQGKFRYHSVLYFAAFCTFLIRNTTLLIMNDASNS